jgi:hypothetical protein
MEVISKYKANPTMAVPLSFISPLSHSHRANLIQKLQILIVDDDSSYPTGT